MNVKAYHGGIKDYPLKTALDKLLKKSSGEGYNKNITSDMGCGYGYICGSWWTSNINVAKTYGKYITEVELIIKNPLIIDAEYSFLGERKNLDIDKLSFEALKKVMIVLL
jgi:hypothetical protein